MKIGTSDRKTWNIKQAKKKLLLRIKRKIKVRHLKNSGMYFQHKASSGLMRVSNDRLKKFNAPRIFSLEDNREETLNFFSSLFEFVDKNQNSNKKLEVYINSSDVIRVTESTLMYLFAIVKDISFSKFDVNGNHPRDIEAKNIYKKCGFDKILKKFNRTSYEDSKQLLYRGNDASTDVASKVCQFVQGKLDCNITQLLYPAIIEMMLNTIQHAYDKDSKLEKKWQINVSDKSNGIKIVFLDTGMGIPETVRKANMEKVKQLIPILSNSMCSKILESAFKGEFRTRTEEENRGKGLPQIFNLLSLKCVKESAVYSGRAIGKFFESSTPSYADASTDFYGTLYEFTLTRGVKNERSTIISS